MEDEIPSRKAADTGERRKGIGRVASHIPSTSSPCTLLLAQSLFIFARCFFSLVVVRPAPVPRRAVVSLLAFHFSLKGTTLAELGVVAALLLPLRRNPH